MDKNTGQNRLSDIEAGLERLVPRGLSDSARDELEVAVDDLAGSSSTVPVWKKPLVWQSAVAALVVTAFGGGYAAKLNFGLVADSRLVQMEAIERNGGIEILEQMTWIDSGADLGVQSLDDSGDISRGWSYSGVEEERVLHERSGYEVILQRGFDAELYAVSSL